MNQHNHHNHGELHVEPMETPEEYFKFALVIIGILVASAVLSGARGGGLASFLNDFMAVFFLAFGLFKLMNLKMFALTFKGYDLVTQKFEGWGFAYPFIQLGLGLGYLLQAMPDTLNMLTIVISAVAGAGVLKELLKKSKIVCACLGNVIRLPLTKISFVEDFLMLGMAIVMLSL